MEQRKQKSQTLPHGVSPGKTSPASNGGLFRRLKRRFRLKSKGYELGEDNEDNVHGVSFSRRSDEYSSKRKSVEYSSKPEKDRQNDIPRTQSDRRVEKPFLTVFNHGNKKKNGKRVNGNGIVEFDKSMERSFEDECVENNFLVGDDQVIDLDGTIEETDDIFIDTDPGYETLDEVRRKMKLHQMSESLVENHKNDNFERENNLRVSLHRRTQSSGTAENCIRTHELMGVDPNRDSGIGSPRIIDINSDKQHRFSSDNSCASLSQRPYSICGDSPNLTRIGSCPIKHGELQNYNEDPDHQSVCNSDTCLCQYSATGDLYANPQILFRKRSQKNVSNAAVFSLVQNADCNSCENDAEMLERNISPDAEGPPLPARKYSMYDDLKTPDSIKSSDSLDTKSLDNQDSNVFLTQKPSSNDEENDPKGKVELNSATQTIKNTQRTNELTENSVELQKNIAHDFNEITAENLENPTESFYSDIRQINDTGFEEISNCSDVLETVGINESESTSSNKDKSESDNFSIYKENADIVKSESTSTTCIYKENFDSLKSETMSYISDASGSLSVSLSSNDTVKCVVLDSPLSTEGESIPEELEILHISEDDEGYSEIKDVKMNENRDQAKFDVRGVQLGEMPLEDNKCEISSNFEVKEVKFGKEQAEFADREVQLGWISEGLENICMDCEKISKDGAKALEFNNKTFVNGASCSENLDKNRIVEEDKQWLVPNNGCDVKSKNITETLLQENTSESQKSKTFFEDASHLKSDTKQNGDLSLEDVTNVQSESTVRNKYAFPPTPETSQTQYFGESRTELRTFSLHHRKSSTLDSVSSFAESDDNSSVRSTEILSDIHVMSYEDDADAILESLASRRNSFADDLDSDTNVGVEAELEIETSENEPSQNHSSHIQRLPDYYYDDSEPIHMSLAELGMQRPEDDGNDLVACSNLPPTVDIDQRPPALLPRSSKETSYRQDFMESMQQLKDCGWYWGPLSWEEAEIKLIDKPDGSFLVRDSSDDRYILSLSFNMAGRVHHTRIEHHKGKFSFWSQPETHGKSTIRQFIEQCVQNSRNGQFLYFVRPSGPGAPPMPVHLLHPVSRFKQMQSLQHGCRFKILQIVRRDHIDYLPIPTSIKNYLKEAQYYVEFLEE